MATYKEVYDASLNYFEGDELAAKTFVDKYALVDNEDDYKELTPTDMHRRLAKEFARIESKYPNPMSEDEIFNLLKDYKFIVPQGSPMSGIGNPYRVQSIGNCFVIDPPLDSYGGILKADQELVQLMKRRAGVGLCLNNIRPKGLPTNNAAKTTDGIAVFMERFSNTCREVAQNGRRGAELQAISIEHPEVRTFITIKQDKKKVTGANVSVQVTDEFMEAVKAGKKFRQRWPVGSENPSIEQWVDAKELWDELIYCAWNKAEPGILFWTPAIKYSPADIYGDRYPDFRSTATNPCGEIILGKDSCRLLLTNLESFVVNPFKENAYFDFKRYGEVVQKAQRLMDDIIDLEIEIIDKILSKIDSDPEPEEVKYVEKSLWESYKKTAEQGRRTGLGVTALGDTIAQLGIRYGSDESIAMTEKIYREQAINSYKSSCIMAGERGAFPIFDSSLEEGHPFLQRIWDASPETYELYKKYGRRNIANTTTAPAGSVSIQTRTTSGIEPAFLISYTRRKKINPSDVGARVDHVDDMGDKWQEFTVYHSGFKKWMDVTGKTEVEDSPYFKATSADVDWEKSVEIQAAAQKWICHSISKTCNVPEETTKELISKIYMRAWESGCKGFTVYREGCRDGVLVSTDEKDKDGRPTQIVRNHAPKRPETLPVEIYHGKVQSEPWVIVVGLLSGEPYEIFGGPSEEAGIPKSAKEGFLTKTKVSKNVNRYDLSFKYNGEDSTVQDIGNLFHNKTYGSFTRTLSLAIRHGAPIQHIVETLSKQEDEDLTSLSSVLRRALKKYITDGTIVSSSARGCEKCGSPNLVYDAGCPTCLDCSYAKCG